MEITIVIILIALIGVYFFAKISRNSKGSKLSNEESKLNREGSPENGSSTLSSYRSNSAGKFSSSTSYGNKTPSIISDNELPAGLNKELKVNYDIPDNAYTRNGFYPYVKYPKKEVLIKPPVRGKSGNKGVVEEAFCLMLLEFLRNLVYDNLTLINAGEPDIAYINITYKNIFIDIEIDEPYDGVSRNPTHVYKETGKSEDELRNEKFTERGWIVLRFSEQQIKETPLGCIRILFNILSELDSQFVIPDNIKMAKLPNKQKMWNEVEAGKMARENEREKYLGIDSFYSFATTRRIELQNTPMGEKIEEQLAKQRLNNEEKKRNSSISAKMVSITTPIITVNPDTLKKQQSPSLSPSQPRVTTSNNAVSKPASKPYA